MRQYGNLKSFFAEEEHFSSETLAHDFWQKFRLKAPVKVIDGSNYATTFVAHQVVFNLLTIQYHKSWQGLRTTNVAMSAFTRKQSREILVPSLPSRPLMFLKLCQVTSRPETHKILIVYWAYARIMHKSTKIPLITQINCKCPS